jgi:hypothetical protein
MSIVVREKYRIRGKGITSSLSLQLIQSRVSASFLQQDTVTRLGQVAGVS